MTEKKYKVAFGTSAKAKQWINKELTWKEFTNHFIKTKRTSETVEEYFNMSKEQRDSIKDVGGFVCGYSKDGKRTKDSITSRSMVCLDLDDNPKVEEVWAKAKLFKCIMYSTHSHTPQEPRIRLIFPLDRDATPEEYEKVAKALARYISGVQVINSSSLDRAIGKSSIFDDTTYQYNRLMFLPSSSKDGEYIYENSGDRPEAKVKTLLLRYNNDIEKYKNKEEKRGNTIQDPRTKDSYIGAFCKAYNIHEAIAKFLNEVYIQGSKEDRYTYIKGGNSGDGLQVFDNGLLAYSHQDHDLISGIGECNSFDLVRIHKFSDLDSEEDINNLPSNKLPSFKKMCELVSNDEKAKKYLLEEEFSKIEKEKSNNKNRDIKLFDFTKSINNSPIKKPNFLIHRLIYANGINLIVGDPKTFKTYIALDIALGVITGTETLGHQALKKGKVLLISTELDVRDRILSLINGRGLKVNDLEGKLRMFDYNNSLDSFEWNKDKNVLIENIKDFRPDLLILDPISYIFDGEITDNDEVKQFFRELKELISEYNFSVILTHHNNRMKNTNKNGKISGAAAFSRHSDSIIHLEKFNEDEKQDINKTDEELDQEIKPIKLIKGDYRFGLTGYRYYTINFKFDKDSTRISANRLELDDILIDNKKHLEHERKLDREEDILKRLVDSIKEGKFNKEGMKKADIKIIVSNCYGVSDNTFNEDIKKALGILINDGYIERIGYYYKVVNDDIQYPFL